MWLVCLVLGCPVDAAKDSDSDPGVVDETGETGETGEGLHPLDDEELYGLWAVAPAPAQILLMVKQGVAMGIPGGCPAVTTEGVDTVVTGGCTDDSGLTWSGTARFDGAADADAVTFDGFGLSVSTVSYALTGEVIGSDVEGGYGTVGTADLVMQGYESYGFPSMVSFRFTTMEVTLNAVQQPLAIAGGMEEVEAGTLTVSATATQDFDACSGEPMSGTAVLDGARVVTLAFDGAGTCDGCIPWTASDGDAGEACER